jgi:hypothetical protein
LCPHTASTVGSLVHTPRTHTFPHIETAPHWTFQQHAHTHTHTHTRRGSSLQIVFGITLAMGFHVLYLKCQPYAGNISSPVCHTRTRTRACVCVCVCVCVFCVRVLDVCTGVYVHTLAIFPFRPRDSAKPFWLTRTSLGLSMNLERFFER